jgi:hypothetical protein
VLTEDRSMRAIFNRKPGGNAELRLQSELDSVGMPHLNDGIRVMTEFGQPTGALNKRLSACAQWYRVAIEPDGKVSRSAFDGGNVDSQLSGSATRLRFTVPAVARAVAFGKTMAHW